ncbi:MAG: PQQ-binding-like beta-propeller repeat protein [Phycisphaerae bacterium]|nr:PQQ-binding-like beta-propeller repeat protein [Phycisphaerae bacterium]
MRTRKNRGSWLRARVGDDATDARASRPRHGEFVSSARASVAALAVVVAIVAGMALFHQQAGAQVILRGGPVMVPGPIVVDRPGNTKGPRMILVNSDDEYASYLAEAIDFLEARQYDEAIRILQELMRMPNGGYVPTGSPGVFRGLRLQAAEALTYLDADGLKRYRMMYDTRARELYNEAVAGDVAKLRTVAQIYAQTSFGARAVERLGAVYFDQGRFAQAEGVWKSLLPSAGLESPDRAVLLARLAAASHFAGHTADCDGYLAMLKEQHEGARGEMGGQMRDLAEYVASLREIDPASIVTGSTREVFVQGWPGLGGVPSGTALMDDSHVLLEPRWTVAGKGDRVDPSRLRDSLLAMSEVLNNPMFRANNNNNTSVRVELDRGHVTVRGTVSGSAVQPFTMPPAVEPVVVGDAVILRTSDAVVAVDIVTGRPIWKTGGPENADLKMERSISIPDGYYGYYYGGMLHPDMGRYRITVGANRIYLVSSFRPSVNPYVFRDINRMGVDRSQLGDTSRLIAIQIDPENPTSPDRQGKRVWELGMGKGSDDLIRSGKFLSAPTYHNGLLYVMLEYIDAYHLVCLDADTGTMRWRTMIAQSPSQQNPYGMQETMGRAAPPAVEDGRVYVATNGGVVAAVEADSGLPLWAYQYMPRGASAMYYRGGIQIGSTPGLNPIIVTGGRVLALPADSAQLLCLSAETGEPLWSPLMRRDLNDLSYIDDRRVLLSGGGLMIIDTTTGEEIWPADKAEVGNLGIVGRPAVSRTAILASGQDCLYRLTLSDYRLTQAEMKSPYGVLGNLVCVDGKLIAANAAGVCAYFNYEEAFRQLSLRVEAQAAAGTSATDLLFQRAQLSFTDSRFDACLADLAACAKAVGDTDTALRARLTPWFYRAHVGAANHSENPADMLAHFTKASEYASTDQERAHLMIRMVKYYRKTDNLKQALTIAQQLGETYGQESLVDVKIGLDADDRVRTTEAMPEKPGRTLAQEYIGAMVATEAGRAAYAEHDAQAKAALEQASAAHDPAALEQVAGRWPHSIHAETALFRAAEEYTLQLPSLTGEPRKEAMGRIVATLSRIMHGGSEMTVQASLSLALVWSRGGVKSFADLALSNLDADQLKAMADQPFAFADYKGTVGELVAAIESGQTAATTVPTTALVSTLPPTYEILFNIKEQSTFLLTDQYYEPIRLMDQVLAVKDQRLVLVDTQARDADSATKWAAISTVSPQTLQTWYGLPATRLVAGLSRDGNVVAVADRESVSGVDVGSQKIRWHKKMTADLGIGSVQFMSIHQGLLLVNDTSGGKLVCVNLGTGEVVWQSPLAGAFRSFAGPVVVRNGMVMAISGDGKGLLCWNLDNGKVTASITAKQTLTAHLTPRGMLAVLADGQLNIRDTNDLTKDLWPVPRAYANGDILAVTDDVVLAVSQNKPDKVDMLSISRGGEVVCTLTIGVTGGTSSRATDALIANGKVYVTCFTESHTPWPRRGMMPASGRGLSVQAFHLKDGTKAWQADIDTDLYFVLMPLRLCGDAVIVSPAYAYAPNQNQPNNQANIVLLSDSQKGKEIVRLSPELETEQRRYLSSPPVITNERILMETAEGLRVIGKR